jgi:hypothetical protein
VEDNPNPEGIAVTQDEIIEMLRASCDKDRVDPEQNGFWVIVTEELEAFAKLVAEREREACAKIADEWAVGWPHPSQSIAEWIRKRT